jgi:hypothetical protein
MKSILDHGSNWPLSPISDENRKAKNSELIQRGNHQSALKHIKILSDTLLKEVNQGWIIPIPTLLINKIPNAEINKY